MAERRLKLRLGLFVAITLLCLAALVVLFGSAPTLFSNRAKYTVLFPEAPGIGPGTPIQKSGVRIGQVTQIDLDPDNGQVRVVIAIDPKYPLRMNEEATIAKGFLSGDTAIDFVPKMEPGTTVPMAKGADYPPGSEIPGIPPITPRSLLTPASGVIASAQQSLDRMVLSFQKLENLSPKLEKALEEIAKLAQDVRLFIPELKKTNERIQNFIGADQNKLPDGAVAFQDEPNPDNLRALVRDVRALMATLRPTLEDFRGTVKRLEPDIAATTKSARGAFDRAGTTFDSVNQLLSPENRKQFDEFLKNLNGIGINILKISAGFQALLDEAEKTIKNFDKRTALTDDILKDIRAFTKPVADRSEGLVKDVADSAGQLSRLITELREVIRTFAREDGTVQKLLTDQNLFANLEAASGSLKAVLARADKIAKDFEVFADKVARRPELIGIGGALHPSSGLKESPFSPVPRGLPSYRPDWPPALPARENRPPAQPNPSVIDPSTRRPPVQGYIP